MNDWTHVLLDLSQTPLGAISSNSFNMSQEEENVKKLF